MNYLFLQINLSQDANTPGNINNIKITDTKAPSEIVSHILAAIAEAKLATIKVTIINIEEELIIV